MNNALMKAGFSKVLAFVSAHVSGASIIKKES